MQLNNVKHWLIRSRHVDRYGSGHDIMMMLFLLLEVYMLHRLTVFLVLGPAASAALYNLGRRLTASVLK